jgi:hypothetical protein
MLRLTALCLGIALTGCTGDNGGTSDAGQDATLEATDICTTFTESGDPCMQASATRCFPECESGGCYCQVSMGGGARWKCVTDLSCMPDCAPIDPNCMH